MQFHIAYCRTRYFTIFHIATYFCLFKLKNDFKELPKWVHLLYYVFICFRMSATTFIQPLDVLKNRMQLSGEGGQKRDHSNTFQAFKNILAKEGGKGLYQGISANMLRQATYTTTRIGMYQNTVDLLSR